MHDEIDITPVFKASKPSTSMMQSSFYVKQKPNRMLVELHRFSLEIQQSRNLRSLTVLKSEQKICIEEIA